MKELRERLVAIEVLSNCALHYLEGPQKMIDVAIANATRLLQQSHAEVAAAVRGGGK